ncbi:MAG: 3'-5' exonuclease, partial [Myxococcota bacterium]
IGDDILTALDDGMQAQDVAILYRTNAQSRPIEDALMRRKVPYAVYGGIRFYDRKEVKDSLAYLRLLINPVSPIDFLRIVNAPARGIGKTSIDRVSDLAATRGVSLLEAAELAAAGVGKLTKRARASFGELASILREHGERIDTAHPARLLEDLLDDVGYLKALRIEGSEESQDRLENLSELVAAIDEYVERADEPSLAGFLEDVTLAADVDGLDLESGQVTLMTLHSAKGLEFPWVFIPGMEDGLFPHSRSVEDRPALEEERRLFYVGITRAKDALMLSAVRVRRVFGHEQLTQLSRFLAEIPAELLDLGDAAAVAPPAARLDAHGVSANDDEDRDQTPFDDDLPTYEPEPKRTPRKAPPEPDDDGGGNGFRRGMRVHHATFGEGQILKTEGTGSKLKLTIEFPEVGRKVIVARFVEPA